MQKDSQDGSRGTVHPGDPGSEPVEEPGDVGEVDAGVRVAVEGRQGLVRRYPAHLVEAEHDVREVGAAATPAERLYAQGTRTAPMDTEKERRTHTPELNPDGTTMTEEDRAKNKGTQEPKPWAPPPRRHGD